MVQLSDLRHRAVRARIAEVTTVLAAPAELGRVRLHSHQRLAVARVADSIARHGGCLLADDVGRGKTYVALAIARRWERPLVVAPASLRLTWQHAMAQAQVTCPIVTHEALSRGSLPSFEPDGIIVDESHRFRSLHAKRHAMLARLAAHVPVLLLSATPLQNGVKDLGAQLALFLGSTVLDGGEDQLARCVVRSRERSDVSLPAVAPPAWLRPACDDGAVLRDLLALPAPARPFDAGDAGALRTVGLVRAWASSRAALVAGLRRRMHLATALEQCAASGLAPSRRDLSAWHGADADVQLALAPLLVSRAAGPELGLIVLTVAAERAALDKLKATLGATADPDVTRIDVLRALRTEHPGARILAFSEFATTVRAYFALLRADAGVGMLTSHEARIASGRLPRDALLQRFAPTAQGARDHGRRERVTLLLATDLLSEGVNLQDASVVVHLDLPWNPARMAQRLGRVRRPGGASVVRSFLMAPPASAELLLSVEARLRAKLARAERAIGRTLHVLPVLSLSPTSREDIPRSDRARATASAEAFGAAADEVASWRRSCPAHNGTTPRGSPGCGTRHCLRQPKASCRPIFSAVRCDERGWLVALDDGRLLARHGAEPPNSTSAVIHAIERASDPARSCCPTDAVSALSEVHAWLEREQLSRDCGFTGSVSAIDDAVARRIARALHRAPRHHRAKVLALATHLRTMLGRPRSLGAERELESLLAAGDDNAHDDVLWFERSIAVAGRRTTRAPGNGTPQVAALIVFGPGDDDPPRKPPLTPPAARSRRRA
jgi:superfamily II DNA or RNA helicase